MSTSTLPMELWDSILELATEIAGEYDIEDSTWYEPEGYFKRKEAQKYASNWIRSLRTRYRIVLVCRSWNALATRYLYGSFYICDWAGLTVGFSKMFSILTSVCENNPHLSGYVKRITLGTRTAFSSQFPCVADPILNLCHNLIKLELLMDYYGEGTKFPASVRSLTLRLRGGRDRVEWFTGDWATTMKGIPHLAIQLRSGALRKVFKSHSNTTIPLSPLFSIVAFNFLTDRGFHPPLGLAPSITHLHVSSDILPSTPRSPAHLPNLRSLSFECNISDDPRFLHFHNTFSSLDSLASLQFIFDFEVSECSDYASSPLQHSMVPKLRKIFLTNHNLTSSASLRWLINWMKNEGLSIEWYATDITRFGTIWMGKDEWMALVSRRLSSDREEI